MTFDPFRPDEAGDDSAVFTPPKRRNLTALLIGIGGVAFLVLVALVAVLLA